MSNSNEPDVIEIDDSIFDYIPPEMEELIKFKENQLKEGD